MKYVVHSEGVVTRGIPQGSRANCCFPSLVRLSGNQLFVAWRTGSAKDSIDGAIWHSASQDEGKTWSEPALLLAAGVRNRVPGEPKYAALTRLRDGQLMCAVMWVDHPRPDWPLFNPVTEGILPLHTLLFRSTDQGLTWNEVGEMDTSPYFSPLGITGPILELANGRLACQFEVNKPYEELSPWKHAAAWKLSSDGGRSWPECIEVARDPSNRIFYWDARYAIDNSLCVAGLWTYDRERGRDKNVHLAESLDHGKTWCTPFDTGIIGQVAHPVLLGKNRLLLLYVDRFETRGIRAALSEDRGRTFDDPITIYQQSGASTDVGQGSSPEEYLQDMDRWTFGRVDGQADDFGNIWVIYYAGVSGATDIRWARLRIAAPEQSMANS